MQVHIRIKAIGAAASGKSHELAKLRLLLEERGYEMDVAYSNKSETPPAEVLVMSREGTFPD